MTHVNLHFPIRWSWLMGQSVNPSFSDWNPWIFLGREHGDSMGETMAKPWDVNRYGVWIGTPLALGGAG